MEAEQHQFTEHLTPVVFCKGDTVFANSRDVAAYFEKRHDNVMRDIDNLLKDEPSLRLLNFEETVGCRPNPSGGEPIPSRAYDMDRKGFVLLCMGFTGKKALKFKMAYIDAFDAMERELREARPRAPPDQEFDELDTSRIRAWSSWVATVGRIYGPAKARALYEKLPWPQVHTREGGAEYDLACDDAHGCLSHLLRNAAFKGQSVRGLLSMAFTDEVAREILAGMGVRAIPGGKGDAVAIANAHPRLDEIFEATPWAGEWRIPLLSLDGAKPTRGKIRFGELSAHGVVIPRGVVMGHQ